MGRKRKQPAVVFLRVFNSDTKLTEEEKAWLLGKKNKDKKVRKEVNGK